MAYKKSLDMFTIYDHPGDFPDHFVVRRWEVRNGSEPVSTSGVWTHDTLDQARDSVLTLHPGAYRIERDSRDDETIVETWI